MARPLYSGGCKSRTRGLEGPKESTRCGPRLQSRNLILGGGAWVASPPSLSETALRLVGARPLDVKEPACYRPSVVAPRCNYDDKSGPVFSSNMTWSRRARKGFSRGSFWGPGDGMVVVERQATAVCLTCQQAHQPIDCQTAGIEQAALPLGDNVVWHLWISY